MPNATLPPLSMTAIEDPDAVLRAFAADLNARGFRAVGMVQAGQCADASLSAVLVHNGEVLALAQDATSPASGCKLDLGRLQDAAARVAGAMEAGADLRDRQPFWQAGA